jgi:N-acetylmuramoyl-L-alanine amidase
MRTIVAAIVTLIVANGPASAETAHGRMTNVGLPNAEVLNSPEARDALARVAYAEAGNQGESGLAAVVCTILNRLADGRWGSTVQAVVDAPHQFEPVARAGGTWRRLAPVSPVQEASIHTIVALALQGRLPDLTQGARYFQNREIVAKRAAVGVARPELLDFGGAPRSVKIGDHTFYRSIARSRSLRAQSHSSIFFGEAANVSPMINPTSP